MLEKFLDDDSDMKDLNLTAKVGPLGRLQSWDCGAALLLMLPKKRMLWALPACRAGLSPSHKSPSMDTALQEEDRMSGEERRASQGLSFDVPMPIGGMMPSIDVSADTGQQKAEPLFLFTRRGFETIHSGLAVPQICSFNNWAGCSRSATGGS